MTEPLLRIGTRGSALALAQTAEVSARLAAAHADLKAPGAIDTVIIRTTGDKNQEQQFTAFSGKSLFTKEIEEALLDGRIDVAMHSGKDLPTFLPPGLAIACCLPREDPRDAFLSPRAPSLAALPVGATIGTSSARRTAQILSARPDLKIVPLRGNIDTRLKKLDAGAADAAVLALAGLKRLGLADRVTEILSSDLMLPAPVQGAILLETRDDDTRTRDYLATIEDPASALCVAAERAFLAAVEGSCRTPIAALAEIRDGAVYFRAVLLKPDGSVRLAAARHGAIGEAQLLAADAGRELLARTGPDFFMTGGV